VLLSICKNDQSLMMYTVHMYIRYNNNEHHTNSNLNLKKKSLILGTLPLLDIVVHKNIRLSNVTVSDIMDSDHLPIIYHILDTVRTLNTSAPLKKFYRLGAVSKPNLKFNITQNQN
jgi:hypothetical protein